MPLKTGDQFSEVAWKQVLSGIASRYRRKGFFQVEVRSKLRPSASDRQGIDATLQIDEGSRTRIRKVTFLGEKVFSRWSLGLKIYSKRGEFYQFDLLQEDIMKLENFYKKRGYFKAIIGPAVVSHHAKTNEVGIKISIQAFNQLDVFFEGAGLFSRKELEPLLLIQKERSSEPDVLEGSARQIARFYRSKGYPFAKVTFRSDASPQGKRVSVHFIIESGARSEMKGVEFSGNHAFSRKILQEQTGLKISSFMRKRYYKKETITKSAALLTHFYQEEGFKTVQVKPEVQFDSRGKSATILFKIDEGIRSRFSKVEILGNKALPDDQLKTALIVKPQIPYTEKRIREGKGTLLSAYKKKGYLYAEIVPSLHFSLDQTDAMVTYHITEGLPVKVGHIKLKGNLYTQDRIILRELAIHPGEAYDPGKILKSQRQIYRTGHFSSVQLNPVLISDQPTLQDIELTVVERPRVALELGVGYANREQFRGFIEVSHRNLWGTGRGISARLKLSRVEEQYLLTYREPWLYGPTVSGRLTAFFIDVQEVSFNLRTFSGIFGIDKTFSPSLKGSIVYQLERKQTTNFARTTEITPEDVGFFTIGSLNLSLIQDTRDDPFNPRRGSVSSLLIRDAAKILGSEVQLVKLILQNRFFQTLSPRWVFAFSARVGVAERFGETTIIPLSERFFLGGRNTIRGYDEDKLGVEGGNKATIVNGIPTGGNAMFAFNEELRLTLPKSFGLVFFLDHGNVWQSYRDVSLKEVKSSAGIGLRYHTPIGPFRLDWGFKLNKEPGESASVFHFTLGHAF